MTDKDPLTPARGVVNGCAIGSLLWTAIFGAAWLLLGGGGGCGPLPPGGIDPDKPAVLVRQGSCPVGSTLTLVLPVLDLRVTGMHNQDCFILTAAEESDGATVVCDETGDESAPVVMHQPSDPLCKGLR